MKFPDQIPCVPFRGRFAQMGGNMKSFARYLKYKTRQSCIFAACDDKYAFCLYVSLWSLLNHSPQLAEKADIFVAGFKVSKENQAALESLPGVRVFDYRYPLPLPQTPSIKNFTEASFARYDCFGLSDYYDEVLYLDSDVLVQKELNAVFEQLSGAVGLVQDPTFGSVRGNFYREIPGFAMDATGYNSGFIALTKKAGGVSGTEICDWLYQKTAVYANDLFLPDQGMINLAVEKFKLRVIPLNESYNCPASSGRKRLQEAFIIHSTGPRKFWCYYYFREWYEGYSRWIAAGGLPVSIHRGSPAYRRILKKLNLSGKIFFQLCPDFFTRPLKALRFTLKKTLKIKF